MITWSNTRQALDRLARRAAPQAARVAGVLLVFGGAWRLWQGRGEKLLQSFVVGVLLMALGIGVGLLRPVALKLLTVLLVAFALLLPAGLLGPFPQMDLPGPRFYPPGFEVHRIAEILGISLAAVLLAHLIGLARLQRVGSMRKVGGTTPDRSER